MLFSLKNRNAVERFPQLTSKLNLYPFNSQDGNTYFMVEINTVEDLLTLDACCRNTDEFFTGLFIEGDVITLSEQPYTLGE